jgi:hypothetical protein
VRARRGESEHDHALARVKAQQVRYDRENAGRGVHPDSRHGRHRRAGAASCLGPPGSPWLGLLSLCWLGLLRSPGLGRLRSPRGRASGLTARRTGRPAGWLTTGRY